MASASGVNLALLSTQSSSNINGISPFCTFRGFLYRFFIHLVIFGHVRGTFFTVFPPSPYFRARMGGLLYRFFSLTLFSGTNGQLMAFLYLRQSKNSVIT